MSSPETKPRQPLQVPTPVPAQLTFRQMVLNAANNHGDRDGEPRLAKSTIFHWLNRLGLWKGCAQESRQAYEKRLCLENWTKGKAKLNSWRMLEDAIYVSQRYGGDIDVEQLKAELEGLRAFGQDESYPERPSNEAAAAAFADAKKVFGDDTGVKTHLPTTIVHHYRRLGLWKEAIARWLAEERMYLKGGFSPDSVGSAAWNLLALSLCVASSIDNLFETLVGQTMQMGFDIGIHTSCVRLVRPRGPGPTNHDELEDSDIDEDDYMDDSELDYEDDSELDDD